MLAAALAAAAAAVGWLVVLGFLDRIPSCRLLKRGV